MSDVYRVLKTLQESIKSSKGGIAKLCAKNGWNYSTYAQKISADDASNYLSSHETIQALVFCDDDSVLDEIRNQKSKNNIDGCHKTLSQNMIKESAEAITASVQSDYLNASTVERNEIDKELREARQAIDVLILSNSKIKNNQVKPIREAG